MTLTYLFKKVLFRLHGRVVTFRPQGKIKGHVLISYSLVGIFQPEVLGGHVNYWTSLEMMRSFLELGYEVDMIDVDNHSFIPKKSYAYFVDIHANMERLAPLLPASCFKIFFATSANWLFQNTAEYTRLLKLQQRRGVTLAPERAVKPNYATEHADVLITYGNEFTLETYKYSGKELLRTPFPSTHTFDFPEHKDFNESKKHYVWFGGAGAVHKGLDITIEAFARMPEYTLTICGKVVNEPNFVAHYTHELALPNIKAVGLIDPSGEEFKKLCKETLGIVFPSCSEGGGGSAIVTMHAGLIPIVTKEASIDTEDFGILLPDDSVEAICHAVRSLAAESPAALEERSKKTWDHVRTHHTRELFSASFRDMLKKFETRRS